MAGRYGTGWRKRPGGWRPWVALAACWLLAVQVMLSGLAFAGHAAPGESGAFAAVICTPAGIRPTPGSATDPAGAPADTHDMNCCLLGCSSAGPSLAPPPAMAAVLPAGAAPGARIAVPAGRLASEFPYSPRRTRAPPISV